MQYLVPIPYSHHLQLPFVNPNHPLQFPPRPIVLRFHPLAPSLQLRASFVNSVVNCPQVTLKRRHRMAKQFPTLGVHRGMKPAYQTTGWTGWVAIGLQS